jgi:hypothetical protein
MASRGKKTFLKTVLLVSTIVLVFAALILRLVLFAGRLRFKH